MLALVAIILILIGTAYLYVKKQYSYWKELGVPGPDPVFPMGTFNRKGNPVMNIMSHYYKYKGKAPFVGLINITSPAILVTDLTFVKNILVRDFQFFSTRGIYHNAKDDPLSAHLFSIDGPKWKTLRTKLTPTFTSGKMKYMFETIVSVSDLFKTTLTSMITTTNQNSPIEMKDLLARFTTDVIGTCAFGVECNSLTDSKAKFREMGLKFFQKPRHSVAGRVLMTSMPDLARFLRLKVMPDDVSEFFLSAVADTVQYRIKNNVHRNDFMDLLIKMYNENKTENDHEGLTFNEIAAQAWVFFLAGFETSSTAMSFALYELSQNQELQQKARKDVIAALERHDNKLTYEAMQDMHFLEQCVNESLRKYPPVPILLRRVVKDYKEPISNVILRKGQMVFIPAFSIQRDAEYYPNPEKYDPDRFSPEEVQKRNPFLFIPFGEGPRICIGLRFGMMQAKIGLAMLLTNFKFRLNKKTPVPLTFTKDNFILATDTGLYFDVEKL